MKKFKLNFPETPSGVLPYGYIISDKGFVGRQKFWQGRPLKLLGFNSTPMAGDMDVITFIDKDVIVAEDMMLGINRYPVFADKEGNWYTYGTPVASITEITK